MFCHTDLNLISLDSHLVGVGGDLRIIEPGAILHAESPGVPRAGDRFVFDVPARQRRTHMRAKVVNRVMLTATVKNRDHLSADVKGLTGTIFNGAHFGDGDEFGHERVQV